MDDFVFLKLNSTCNIYVMSVFVFLSISSWRK